MRKMLGTLVPLSIFATWVMVVELYTVPKLLTVFLIDPVDFHIYRLAGEALAASTAAISSQVYPSPTHRSPAHYFGYYRS